MSPIIRRMRAFALVRLGMPEDHFWTSTPREVHELGMEWKSEQKRLLTITERQTARFACIMVNMFRDREKHPHPIPEEEFMPREVHPQTWDQQKKLFRALFGMKDNNGR